MYHRSWRRLCYSNRLNIALVPFIFALPTTIFVFRHHGVPIVSFGSAALPPTIFDIPLHGPEAIFVSYARLLAKLHHDMANPHFFYSEYEPS